MFRMVKHPGLMDSHRYQAYDFSLQTPFACPELLPAAEAPDVVVTFGAVPGTLHEPRQVGAVFEARPGQFLLRIDGVARYLVEAGRSVTIDPDPGSDPDDVRLFLLSTCLTVIILQRGEQLTLHAGGVRTPEGAVLFVGYSGSGKSTLLREFLRRGCPMISDDVVPVRTDGSGTVLAQPAFPYMKLCGDAAEAAGLPIGALPRIRRDARVDKFGIAVREFSPEPSPVRAVYVLVPSEQAGISLKALDNPAKLRMLLYRTAGMPFVQGMGLRDAHFKLVTRIGAGLDVKRVTRPWNGSGVRDLADAIEADLG